MGKLVIQMTKAREIDIDSSSIVSWTDNASDSKSYNPSDGFINIQAFDFTFSSGVSSDTSSNLTLNRPRVTIGAANPIPITLTCGYLEDKTDNADLINNVSFLDRASKSGYIGLMYWLPNTDSEIDTGQAQDYWSSVFRVLHTNEWNGVKMATTDLGSGYSGFAINAYCLPVVITSADCTQVAGKKEYDITINLELLVQEEN